MKKIYIVVLICMFPLFAAVGYAQVVEITGHVYLIISNICLCEKVNTVRA